MDTEQMLVTPIYCTDYDMTLLVERQGTKSKYQTRTAISHINPFLSETTFVIQQ